MFQFSYLNIHKIQCCKCGFVCMKKVAIALDSLDSKDRICYKFEFLPGFLLHKFLCTYSMDPSCSSSMLKNKQLLIPQVQTSLPNDRKSHPVLLPTRPVQYYAFARWCIILPSCPDRVTS